MAARVPVFLAAPDGGIAGRPAIVVVMEGKGLSQQLLRVCQRLARAGYTAIAPDLYHRFGGSDAERSVAEAWRDALEPAQVLGDLDDCIASVRQAGASSVGITGFCMGGAFAYVAATRLDVQAAAIFYGQIAGRLGDPVCPIRLFYGTRDAVISHADLAAIAARHRDALRVFDGAGHGFLRDGSDDFHPAHAAAAWQDLLALFGEHLR